MQNPVVYAKKTCGCRKIVNKNLSFFTQKFVDAEVCWFMQNKRRRKTYPLGGVWVVGMLGKSVERPHLSDSDTHFVGVRKLESSYHIQWIVKLARFLAFFVCLLLLNTSFKFQRLNH